MKIEYTPIGTVHSPFTEMKGMPIQPSRGKGIKGTVEVLPDFVEGLADLHGFSHVILLCHLHRAGPYRLKVIPYLDDQERGLFATRAPSRPNPIGFSVVRLAGIEGNIMSVVDLDILDGTPVLDIKPWVADFDTHDEVRVGWLEVAGRRGRRADDRFDGCP